MSNTCVINIWIGFSWCLSLSMKVRTVERPKHHRLISTFLARQSGHFQIAFTDLFELANLLIGQLGRWANLNTSSHIRAKWDRQRALSTLQMLPQVACKLDMNVHAYLEPVHS